MAKRDPKRRQVKKSGNSIESVFVFEAHHCIRTSLWRHVGHAHLLTSAEGVGVGGGRMGDGAGISPQGACCN